MAFTKKIDTLTNIKGTTMAIQQGTLDELLSYYGSAVTKHPQILSTPRRLLTVMEELGEVSAEYTNYTDPRHPNFGLLEVAKIKMKDELFQVAVTALRMIQENLGDEDNIG